MLFVEAVFKEKRQCLKKRGGVQREGACLKRKAVFKEMRQFPRMLFVVLVKSFYCKAVC